MMMMKVGLGRSRSCLAGSIWLGWLGGRGCCMRIAKGGYGLQNYSFGAGMVYTSSVRSLRGAITDILPLRKVMTFAIQLLLFLSRIKVTRSYL